MSTKLGKIIADFRTSLSTTLAIGDTTATLQSATDDDGVALPSGTYFFTLDGNSSSKEHITCSLTGTAISSIKSVSRQGVQTVGVARKHRIGATVEITDFAHIKEINNLLDGTTDLNASTPLKYDGTATISTDNHLATKKYVDDTAVSGAPDASTTVKGVAEEATSAEILAGTAAGATAARLFTNPSTLVPVIQDSSLIYAADAQANDTYVITLSSAPASYSAGQSFFFKANTANTGVATLNVNSLGAKTIKKNHDQDLETNDIESGSIVHVVYDGTNFQMMNQQATMPSTADLTEAGIFFATSNMTASDSNTLVGGSTSNADSLHTHSNVLVPFTIFASDVTLTNTTSGTCSVGYSDDPSTYTLTGNSRGSTNSAMLRFIYLPDTNVPIFYRSDNTNDSTTGGTIMIGTKNYRSSGSNIYSTSGAITIVGTTPSGSSDLGHDVTNNYLLVHDTTTTVKRYSGIPTNTITYVDSITLDNAVDMDKGFIYDNVNTSYYFIDNDSIRKFNSSGVTQSTTTIGDVLQQGFVKGLCFINDRIYIVMISLVIETDPSNSNAGYDFSFIPTSITR